MRRVYDRKIKTCRNPFYRKKRNQIREKIDVGKMPVPTGKNIYFIGHLYSIVYVSAEKKELYEHKFKKPRPLLVTDIQNLFIKKQRLDMHFNPQRGIIN